MSQRTILPVLLAMSAFAGTVPASWAQDARLSSRLYSPDEIVRVEGKLNVQATIAFGEGEKIENVAVGDSESWQIAPNKRADLLFIKPLTETARTNMTVVTDRHTYFFDLVASPKAQPIYALRFTYATPAPAPAALEPAIAQPAAATAEPAAVQPSAAEQRAQARRLAAAASAARAAEAKRIDDQRKAERQAARARAAAEAKRAADARSAQRAAERAAQRAAKTAPAASNAALPAAATAPAATATAPAWKRSGSRELMPQAIYDDGRTTFAVWPAGKPLPQMLVADAQGREVPVAFAVDGEKIVIPGVPGRIILRANGRSGTLEPGRAATVARPAPIGQ